MAAAAWSRRCDAGALFDAVTANGATVVGTAGGTGHRRIDYAALTADSIFDDVDEAETLLARMSGALRAPTSSSQGGRLSGMAR